MTRRDELWKIIEDAVRNTRKRHPLNRGPWLISDEYLDECIRKFDENRT